MKGSELAALIKAQGFKLKVVAAEIGMTPRGLRYALDADEVEKRTEIAIRHVIECNGGSNDA